MLFKTKNDLNLLLAAWVLSSSITLGILNAPAAMAAPSDRATPQMEAVLAELRALAPKPIETLSASEARIQPNAADAVRALLAKRKAVPNDMQLRDVRDIMIEGAAGQLQARVYTPQGTTHLPLIIFFHGGGWVLADREVYDSSARALANKASAIVLSVDYRLAPENKFPAAHDDAFAAYRWATINAASLGADANHLVLAGEGAGGNLAVSAAVQARDAGLNLPVHVLAIYPVSGTDMSTASYMENQDAKPLDRPLMAWFFKNYVRNPDDLQDPRLKLVSANLQKLPPTTIITADIDPLRSEGELLAERMRAQGVSVHYKNFAGVTHDFFGMADVLTEAAEAQALAAQDLKSTFRK